MTSVVAVPASFAQERFWFAEQVAGQAGGHPAGRAAERTPRGAAASAAASHEAGRASGGAGAFGPRDRVSGGAAGQGVDRPARHNMHLALELAGPLDVPAFRAAFQRVVARHESLRTTLRAIGGRPHQVIADTLAVPMPVVDVASHEVPARAAAHARRRFDLAAGPLLRTELLRTAPDRYVWLLTLHHAVCDGWSLGVLLGEVSAAYRGEPLPPPALQYADHALWQRSLVERGDLDRDVAYWTESLAGAPRLLELPIDRRRPRVSGHHGALLTLDPLPEGLAALARRERATPYMATLAAFALLLNRVTGTDDLVIGTVHAGRDRPETEALIGCFANTLPLRVGVRPGDGFRALLAHARETVLAAHDHANVPFDRIVQAVNPDRALGHNPLFQVMLDVEPGASGRLDLPGVDAVPLTVTDRGVALFDLSLTVAEGGRMVCEYSTELFDEHTVVSLMSCLPPLVDAALAEPDRPVRELPLLRRAERERILALGATSATTSPTSLTSLTSTAGPVPVAVAEVAARRPGSVAVEEIATASPGPASGITYGELDRAAAALAGRLARQGVGRGSLVAVCCDRSHEAIVAICGVLRAGAAYLPIDPEHPDARITRLIDQAAATAIVTSARHAPRLPGALVVEPLAYGASGTGTDRAADVRQVIDGDAAAGSAGFVVAADVISGAVMEAGPVPAARAVSGTAIEAGFPGVAIGPVAVQPDDLAYVMFTSGSTGRPKGVEVTHRGLAAYVAADLAAYGLTPDDRVLQFGSLGFDLSAEEIFPCLAAGATLVLRSDDMLDSPQAFLEAVARARVTVAHLPTSLLNVLCSAVAEDGARVPGSLRLIVIGGEPADPAHVDRWRSVAPAVRLAHVYGVTEASMVSTLALLDPSPSPSAASVRNSAAATPSDLPVDPGRERLTIGRPIPGTEIHLLDGELEPVPDGVPGEIHIGGAGLARGYVRDPGRTAERFVPHPYADGRRLYRTGDLGRRSADGALEFIGRVDRQISLRGYRIEPGETEAALRTHPVVREAAVTVRDERLVAYVVPVPVSSAERRSTIGLARDLRAHAARVLPGHLVPAAYVFLAALPKTESGKVDLRALPDPEPEGDRSPAELSGETQHAVAEIWREVLGVDQVGADDDFFQLGGHSLLAARVAARMRRMFGVAAGVRLIFEHPRLADVAAAVDRARTSGAGTAAAPRLTAATPSHAARVLTDVVGDGGELTELLRGLGITSHD
ncbi:amino acid adenylation domain-containing protein [Microtetraspora fusca]|uniref:Amino acid adenylation domain-containing protein n=1 Tax=Microtetraspora fusca TaxID=1997 RepID=A0ABW6VH67_MICFU